MQFSLEFTTGNEKLGLFDSFQSEDGLDLIELVKEKTGLDVQPEMIITECSIDMRRSSISIKIPRKINEKDSHWERNGEIIDTYPVFKHFSDAKIIVSPGWFGQFVKQEVELIYETPTIEDFFPKWHFLKCEFENWLGLNFIAAKCAKNRHSQAIKNHNEGKKLLTLERVKVKNVFSTKEIVKAWFEDQMPQYWGIDEERHIEMIMREIACAEEKARKEEQEEKEKERKLHSENKINLENLAEDLAILSSRVKKMMGSKSYIVISKEKK